MDLELTLKMRELELAGKTENSDSEEEEGADFISWMIQANHESVTRVSRNAYDLILACLQESKKRKLEEERRRILEEEFKSWNAEDRLNAGSWESTKSASEYNRLNLMLPDHQRKRCIIYKYLYLFATSRVFGAVINLLIILNTIVLATDRYPISDLETKISEYINLVFTISFFFEMIIKLFGLGIKQYVKDRFNLFDMVIVLLSLADTAISLSGRSFEGGGAISAFRAFRLLRVFKLAKAWKEF